MSDKIGVNLDRLRELIDSESARQVIADNIGCDVSTITKHYNGDRNVTTDYLIKYAKYFNVSTDYLLGLTNASTTDTSIKSICDYTGLDEKNVELLHNKISSAADTPPIFQKDIDFVVKSVNYFIKKLTTSSLRYLYNFNDLRDKTKELCDSLSDFFEKNEKTPTAENVSDSVVFSKENTPFLLDCRDIELDINAYLYQWQQVVAKDTNDLLISFFSDEIKRLNDIENIEIKPDTLQDLIQSLSSEILNRYIQ